MADAQRKVHVIVARAYRACCLACGAEALFVGVFGLLVALAAIAWQGAALATFAAWGAALLAGTASGAAWWLTVRPERLSIARRIDRELGLDGAFLTVFDQRGGASADLPVAQLLARRIGERVSPAIAKRSAVPNSMPFLALPFLGATLLAIVRAGEPTDTQRVDLAAGIAGLSGALEHVEGVARASARTGEIDMETLRELVDLKARARELSRAASAPESESSAVREQVAELRAELERQERERSPLSELAAALDEAATRADALLVAPSVALETGAAQDSVPASGASGNRGAGAGGGLAQRGPAGGESAPGTDRGLANGRADGRMEGPPATGGRPVGPDPAPGWPRSTPVDSRDSSESRSEDRAGQRGAAGVASGRWWSERDAAVVERWVQWRPKPDLQTETRDETD